MYWIETLSAGPFATNAYLCGAEETGSAVLIDAPPESLELVDRILTKTGRVLESVVFTHPHFDHTLDAFRFAARNTALYAHPDGIDGVRRPRTLGLLPEPAGGFPDCGEVRALEPGKPFSAAGLDFGIRNAPGHCDGSVVLVLPGNCFVGDVIFRSSVGRTDLPGGDFEVLAESIRKAIYTLPDETILYPGHGPLTTVGSEKSGNPFVRG